MLEIPREQNAPKGSVFAAAVQPTHATFESAVNHFVNPSLREAIRSDRASQDADEEVQNPLGFAIAQALKEMVADLLACAVARNLNFSNRPVRIRAGWSGAENRLAPASRPYAADYGSDKGCPAGGMRTCQRRHGCDEQDRPVVGQNLVSNSTSRTYASTKFAGDDF